MEAALSHEQLPLFRRLAQPRGARHKRRRSRIIVFIERVIGWVQLELGLPEPVDPDADDDYDFPRHRVIAAAEAEAARTVAAPSIFALAARIAAKSKRAAGQHRVPAFVPSAPGGLHSVAIERRDGITRNVGAMYPAGRWTPEKEEAERVRRAKQRPPKPTRQARTRSAKLLGMIGEADEP